jgi:hypothetical protein
MSYVDDRVREIAHSGEGASSASDALERIAAIVRRVIEDCAIKVDRDVEANWERAENNERDEEEHEAVAMALGSLAFDIRALASPTKTGEPT